ncbi:MAG: AI-2E family transporter [Oscillospiraceae bacterium]|nr:AI-2E family transporter [Oscillospiraceae bacterium]
MQKKTKRTICGIIAYALVLFALLFRAQALVGLITSIAGVFRPILLGVLFALALDGVVGLFERTLFASIKREKPRRACAVFTTYFLLAGILSLAPVLLVPALRGNIEEFMKRLPAYTDELMTFFREAENRIFPGAQGSDWLRPEDLLAAAADSLRAAVGSAYNFTAGAARLVLSAGMSVYILLDEKKLARLFRESRSLFPKNAALDAVYRFVELAAETFRRFISGQLLEASLLGLLCFVGMVIIRLPYAPLISLLIALTSIIPVIGAYLGAIPSALLLFLENPVQAAAFLIFMIALQQFEGSVLYPRVVGDAIGLDGFFVFAAVVLGAGYGGVLGVLVSVPFTAVLYRLFCEELEKKREEK